MAQNISKNFSKVGDNIRKIRQAKKISQAQFAKLFNLARPSVGAYEEGRSEPKIDTIIQIAKHFRISIDVLLTRNLTVSEIYSFDLLNQKLDKAHRIKDDQNTIGKDVGFVPLSEQLNYIVNHSNNSYIKGLQKIKIPVSENESYRVFELQGNEMEHQQQGLIHGNYLICKQIGIKDLKKTLDEVIVLVTKERILTRRLSELNKNILVLNTDNPNYDDLEIEQKDVLEFWQTIAVYNTSLNPPTRMEERMLRIEEELKKLKGES